MAISDSKRECTDAEKVNDFVAKYVCPKTQKTITYKFTSSEIDISNIDVDGEISVDVWECRACGGKHKIH